LVSISGNCQLGEPEESNFCRPAEAAFCLICAEAHASAGQGHYAIQRQTVKLHRCRSLGASAIPVRSTLATGVFPGGTSVAFTPSVGR
jgi:hypothetical protein